MMDVSKPDQLKDSLKITVKRRGNLRRMFTNEGKELAPIFDKADQGEIAEDDIENLKASQQKLLDARPEMRQLDKEIQNIHVILGEEDTADKDFVDTDNISDTHSVLLKKIDKIFRRDQQLKSPKSTLLAGSGASKQLKHSALKLPKISLPVFDGDRRKWLSFWDVFKSEVHDVKDISNVTKFNFLKGQLSEQVAYISQNNQACKSKPAPSTKALPPPKPPLPKVPPINGVLGETVPPGTATAPPAAVTPFNQI